MEFSIAEVCCGRLRILDEDIDLASVYIASELELPVEYVAVCDEALIYPKPVDDGVDDGLLLFCCGSLVGQICLFLLVKNESYYIWWIATYLQSPS